MAVTDAEDVMLADLCERLAGFAGKRRFSITRRRRKARLPQTEEERTAPLHAVGIPPFDVRKLRSRMRTDVRVRFDHLCDLAFSPQLDAAFRTGRVAKWASRSPTKSRSMTR